MITQYDSYSVSWAYALRRKGLCEAKAAVGDFLIGAPHFRAYQERSSTVSTSRFHKRSSKIRLHTLSLLHVPQQRASGLSGGGSAPGFCVGTLARTQDRSALKSRS